MSEHHDHRDDCPFKFATLDVCDCVEKNMLDRIEALTAKLATCEKYRDAYDEMGRIGTQAVRDLEAKLAKAVWLLTDAAVQLEEGNIKTRRNRAGMIWQFLEEIKST